MDFLHFWICLYMTLKNFTCKIIALYIKWFRRYGSPNLGTFLEGKFIDIYDDICLLNIFKTISSSESYIIGRMCFKYSKFSWFFRKWHWFFYLFDTENDLDVVPCLTLETWWHFIFFVHKGEGIYNSYTKYLIIEHSV